jgi:hypothetical protein
MFEGAKKGVPGGFVVWISTFFRHSTFVICHSLLSGSKGELA